MSHKRINGARAVLIDIDGVLTVSWHPLPGTVAAFAALREAGLRLGLLTNTTSRTRASIASTLAAAGYSVGVDDVFTAPVLTAAYLRRHYTHARCLLLNHGDIGEDLAGVELVPPEQSPDEVDVVLLGGAGPEFGYAALDRAFAAVQHGAALVAMHRNLYWRTDEGLQLDTGAFLVGLERAAECAAEVVGKPSAEFFGTALDRLDAAPSSAVMVGDDVEADVLGAQAVGITGVLVRTGKYQPESLAQADGPPDHVIDSFADLPALLGVPTGPR